MMALVVQALRMVGDLMSLLTNTRFCTRLSYTSRRISTHEMKDRIHNSHRTTCCVLSALVMCS